MKRTKLLPTISPCRINTGPQPALWLTITLLLAIVFVFPSTSQSQTNFVYVNNQTLANSVSAYSADGLGGFLTPVFGSPFLTGGNGSSVLCGGLDRIIVSPANKLLFVTNTSDQTVSAFTIDPLAGALTAVPGSPFPSGLTLDSCAGMSLASTPDGRFLMVSSNGQIQTFSVAANGVLTLAATTAHIPATMSSMKISPNGQLLATQNQTSVSVYTINAVTGALTAVPGSPFPTTGNGVGAGLDFSCSNTRLYGAENSATSSITDAWTVAPNGALSPIVGSPFLNVGSGSNSLALSSDNTVLFQSNSATNTITSFTVNPDGSIANLATFAGAGSTHVPGGLATSSDGSLLYVADDASGLAVLTNTSGTLALGVLTPTPNPVFAGAGQIQGLAAYPAKTCALADLSIAATVTPTTVPAGVGPVAYHITVTNNGPSAAGFTVVDNLPTGLTVTTCTATGGGVCDKGKNPKRLITFASLLSGQSGTITISAATVDPTLLNGTVLVNVPSIINATTVDPNPVNNSVIVNATVSAATAPATLTVASATGPYFGSATLSAKLTRSVPATPAAGRTLTFAVNSVAVGSAVTDATGTATITTSLAGINAGTLAGATTVSFAGDIALSPVISSGTLVVTKDVLTVSAVDNSKLYGDPNPAFTYVLSGFVNNETASVVTGTASCTSTAGLGTAVGVNPITCTTGTMVATNYSFSFVKGNLTINPAPLTSAGNNVSRVYGDPNPAITGVLSGLRNNDTATATFAVAAVLNSPVGQYPIIPTVTGGPSFKATNYLLVLTGALTVTPAPLTVVANPATRLYGAPDPAFSGTISGARNGDIITATYASTATQASAVGTYPIVATLTGLTGNNYTVTTSGTLSVTPAPLTLTTADASRAYGGADPVFTGTFSGLKNADNITATFATTAIATSGVGTYTIVPTLVDPTNKLGNYSITSNNGVLTVTAAALVVSGTNVSRLYGDLNPAFAGTIIGLKNSDVIAATFASAATATSIVGPYSIVPTLVDPAGKLVNYSVTSNNGTLTVKPATLTVTGANATRLFGVANPAFTGTVSGLKNADAITATFDSPATLTSAVGTYPIVPTLVDPTGKLGNYTVISKNGVLNIQSTPAVVSVTPSAGTGLSQLFQLTYSDPAGFAAITSTQTIINSTRAYAGSCAAMYTASTQTLAIINDNGAGWGVAAKLGVPGVLQNSQCSIDVGASSAAGVGNNLTLNLAITFKPIFTGAKSTFTYAANKFALNSGWQTVGAWSVPASAPAAVSVTPSAGSGLSQLFQLTYSDPAGFAAITSTQTIINSTRAYAGSCAAMYTASTQTLAIINDNGAGWGVAAKLGVPGVLQNSQCSIDVGASSAAGVGNNLTLNLAITFKPIFTGAKSTFTYAANKFALNSGWQTVGAWSVPASAPSVVSVTPSAGVGLSQLFQLTYSDPAGFGAITSTQTIINSTRAYAGSCAASYTASTQTLAIINDNGAGWGVATKLGVPGVLQNSQCSIDVGASSAAGVGNNLTLNLAITFKPIFTGAKSTFTYAANKFALNSGWQTVGAWSVPASAPSVVSVTPSAGAGLSQLFQLTYSDPAGFGAITSTQTIINSTRAYAGSCAAMYTASTQTLAIINDNGAGWGVAAKLGVPGVLQNSQCSIDVGASSAAGVGNNLTLNLAVTFKPIFAGAKGTYTNTTNRFALSSGWQTVGAWSVPASAPSVVSVTPSAGSGLSQLFQLTYSDPAGFAAITSTQTIINSTRAYAGSCAAMYTASTQTLAIINDNGAGWGVAAKLGVPGVLQNSQCSIDVGASSAAGVGNNLTLNLAIIFKPIFTGVKGTYTNATNRFTLNSGWQTIGTWIP